MDYKRLSKDNVLTWPLNNLRIRVTTHKMEFLETRELLQKHKTVRLPKLRGNILWLTRLYRHALVFTPDSIPHSITSQSKTEGKLFFFTVKARRLGDGGGGGGIGTIHTS